MLSSFFLNIGLNVVALNKVSQVAASAKSFNSLELREPVRQFQSPFAP